MEIVYVIIIGAIIAGIYLKTLMNAMNNVTGQKQANIYMEKDSFCLKSQRDRFIYSNVVKIAKPQNNGGKKGRH